MQITAAVKKQYERAKLWSRLDKLDIDQATKDKVLAAGERAKEIKGKSK
ncbi:MAG: hypothetical protein HY743_05085 [Deltaproteobacteria bacterium]|nr:hypothetical protein [Deltaproteobacteria bacterium]